MEKNIVLDLGKEIVGESEIKNFEGKIDILAWSWGLSNNHAKNHYREFSSEEERGAGNFENNFHAHIQDINITKWVDCSSANLLELCNNQNGCIPEARLLVFNDDESQSKYLTYTLKNVRVTFISTGGSEGSDRYSENIGLHFEKMLFEYNNLLTGRENKVEL